MKVEVQAADARVVADKFIMLLEPHCTRVVVAGSLRRQKPVVGDIEILFVPRFVNVADDGDLFGGATKEVSAADLALDAALTAGIITKRANKDGVFSWGRMNKLAVHVASGIPVDFFTTTEACFFNALVVRTGPADLNRDIAKRAIERGWHWQAAGDGFTRGILGKKRVTSEGDVFRHVGLSMNLIDPKLR